MITLIEQYKQINKDKPKNEDEKFILDCFEYNVFKLKPSKEFKEEFKQLYEIKYPKTLEEIPESVKKEIKTTIDIRKKDREFDEKMKTQRYERGFSDLDVWNFNSWFSTMVSEMLKQLAENHMGHPVLDSNNKSVSSNSKSLDNMDKEWTNILNRMSFLARELNDETCSWKDEHEKVTDKWYQYHIDFDKEFKDKNVLKTEAELQEEKDTNTEIMVFPDRHPDKTFVAGYKQAKKELFDFEKKLFKYQNKCKNELFKLLSKYYWDLWD